MRTHALARLLRCEPRLKADDIGEEALFGAADDRPLAEGAIVVCVAPFQASKTKELSMRPGDNFEVDMNASSARRRWWW